MNGEISSDYGVGDRKRFSFTNILPLSVKHGTRNTPGFFVRTIPVSKYRSVFRLGFASTQDSRFRRVQAIEYISCDNRITV